MEGVIAEEINKPTLSGVAVAINSKFALKHIRESGKDRFEKLVLKSFFKF